MNSRYSCPYIGDGMKFFAMNDMETDKYTLQMKCRWESNINVWFPFMYSQNWNCYLQNRIIMFSLPVPTLIYLWEIIYFQDQSAYSAAGKHVDRSLEYINHSQTQECGNWDWGRAFPRKGIHKRDFPCSVGYTLYVEEWMCLNSIFFKAFSPLKHAKLKTWIL